MMLRVNGDIELGKKLEVLQKTVLMLERELDKEPVEVEMIKALAEVISSLVQVPNMINF